MKSLLIISYTILLTIAGIAQEELKPYFDPIEYKTLLEISARQSDTPWTHMRVPYPEGYKMAYRSEVTGMDNRWDLWLNDESKIAVISIRGTTLQLTSWLEDFYAAMIPAQGIIELDKKFKFNYQLASDSSAYVHAGWTIGLAYLSGSIIDKINESYKNGFKEFIIMGHSQGAGIAYLLRSYLFYLEEGIIPADIHFKTYCSAAPKPGNLFYAYDYDFITRGGWAVRVVSSLDWVPQMPVTVQTVNDMVLVNPFSDIHKLTDKMEFVERIIVRSILKGLIHDLEKARKKLTKNLGNRAYKFVRKTLPDYVEPDYARSSDYYPAGNPVVLRPDKTYYEKYYDKQKFNLFINHLVYPYYLLLNEIYLK